MNYIFLRIHPSRYWFQKGFTYILLVLLLKNTVKNGKLIFQVTVPDGLIPDLAPVIRWCQRLKMAESVSWIGLSGDMGGCLVRENPSRWTTHGLIRCFDPPEPESSRKTWYFSYRVNDWRIRSQLESRYGEPEIPRSGWSSLIIIMASV